MNVSSVKNLNGEIFSAVQDTALTDVVQTNSAQWGQGGGGSVSSKYGTIIVDGSDIEATNSAIEFKNNGFRTSFGYTNLSEYNQTATFTWNNYSEGTTLNVYGLVNHDDSDGLTYSSNTNVTGLITASQWNPTEVSLSLPNATAVQFSANHRYGLQSILVSAPSSYQVKELAWKSDLPTYTYDSTNKISAINGSALAGGGGGSSGGFYSESAILYQGSKSDSRTTAWSLNDNISNYKMIQCDWIDTNNYFISKQITIPSGLGNDMTRAAFFDAVFEYGSDLWCKAQRFSAQNNNVYAQVDEYCVHTDGTVSNVGSDVINNRPIMVQIIGVK